MVGKKTSPNRFGGWSFREDKAHLELFYQLRTFFGD